MLTLQSPQNGNDHSSVSILIGRKHPVSNAVHQASKEPAEGRKAFWSWLYDFEYDKLSLPRPDLIIYLDMPTDFTEKLMRHRESSTGTTADIHEKDMQYLATCRQIGRAAANFYGWTVISCVKDGAMRTIDDIHQEIYSYVKSCLEA